MKKFWGRLSYGLLIFLTVLSAILYFSIKWAMSTWANLALDEMIYTLLSPLEGTGNDMIGKYISSCLVPALVLLVVLVAVLFVLRKTDWGYVLLGVGSVVMFGIMSNALVQFCVKLDVAGYVEDQSAGGEFIQANYANPGQVVMEFPEEKRNLVMIFLESMETTFTDRENGGAFDDNLIPELTYLAQENEDFSGSDDALNGGFVMPSTSWTMAALFAHTSGLPLQISIDGNAMDTQEEFFPNAVCLGDILEEQGYQQCFLIGSDATFGGRRLYFTKHGNYEIIDYITKTTDGTLPSDYMVNWGYEDAKLFEYAKEKLLDMAAGEQPFNFTMLTVDTHFEDGYLCEDCGNDFGGDQYSNVYACSSKKVAAFVEWIQAQDFYENTTIVLVGDHLTMDSDFCDEVSGDFARYTYTNYINAACENKQENTRRSYTTLDTLPTVLAAMGVEIEGNRLGLGTNLFSKEKTLVEKYGVSYVASEIKKKSTFMEQLANVDADAEAFLQREGAYPEAELVMEQSEDGESLRVIVRDIQNMDSQITAVELEIYRSGEAGIDRRITLKLQEDGSYMAELNPAEYAAEVTNFAFSITSATGSEYELGELTRDMSLPIDQWEE